MKQIKKQVSIFVILAVLLVSSMLSAQAAGATASIAVSSTAPTVGSNITVTVTYSTPDIGGVQGYLNYNPSVLQYVSGANTNGGSGKIVMSQWRQAAATVNSMSFSMTFKVIGAGSSALSVSGSSVWNYGEQLVGNPAASTSITAKTAASQQKSSNALLKGLTISAGSLSPAFSSNTFTYSVSLPNTVDKLLVTAYTADPDATWTVEGSSSMQVGANQRVVVVTAPDGTVKRYNLNIQKAAGADADASSSQNTSSEENTESPEIDTSVKIKIDEAEYTLLKSLEGIAAPAGFSLDISNYAGDEIPVFKSESGCELVVLQDAEGSQNLFVYNNSNVSFYKAQSILLGAREYLFVGVIDSDDTADLSVKEIELAEKTVQVYHSNELFEGTVCLYAINEKGELNLYLYDTAEDLVMPYDHMVITREEKVVDSAKETDNSNDLYLKISFLVCAVLLVAVIVMLVLLIASKRKRKQAAPAAEIPFIGDDELKL